MEKKNKLIFLISCVYKWILPQVLTTVYLVNVFTLRLNEATDISDSI